MRKISGQDLEVLIDQGASSERRRDLLLVDDLDPHDREQKARMMLKLFSLFAKSDDVEYRIEAYLEELVGIPWRWISSALARLTEEEVDGKPRVFVPSIAEIKLGVAKLVRDKRRRVDREFNAQLSAGGSSDSDIAWLRRVVSEQLERGDLPLPPGQRPGGTPELPETAEDQPSLLIDN